MVSRVQAETIRQHVRQLVAEHGGDSQSEMAESLLIRGGHFCGRRFELDGMSAVWFVEENELKVYDRQGELLAAVDASSVEQRKAA